MEESNCNGWRLLYNIYIYILNRYEPALLLVAMITQRVRKKDMGIITIDDNKINRYYLRVCYSQA